MPGIASHAVFEGEIAIPAAGAFVPTIFSMDCLFHRQIKFAASGTLLSPVSGQMEMNRLTLRWQRMFPLAVSPGVFGRPEKRWHAVTVNLRPRNRQWWIDGLLWPRKCRHCRSSDAEAGNFFRGIYERLFVRV
jgi:hypothetical protein